MRSATLLLPALALFAGCAAPTATPADTPVRFAVIAAPTLAAVDVEGEELTPEDALLEVVTQLSLEESLDFILVPGPLVASEDEDLRLGLIGALGSLAGDLILALAPTDAPQAKLLEAFEELLPGHEGKLAYRGKRAGPVVPVALDPQGGLPESDEANDGKADKGLKDSIFVQGGAESSIPTRLVVRAGSEVRLEANGNAPGATLVLPSVAKPPHIYAIAELREGMLSVRLSSVLEADLADPAPIRLIPVGSE